jgi:hypothetical protein
MTFGKMAKSQLIISDFDPAGAFAELILPPAFRQRQKETRFKQEWKVTIPQYIQLMREFVGLPKRQRGIIQMMGGGMMVGGAEAFVQLTAHSVSEFRDTAGVADAWFEFQNDGELWGMRNISADAQYPGQWWSDEPETLIGDDYAVRHLSSGKTGTYNLFEAAVADTWITATATRSWGIRRSIQGVKTTVATFEVGPQPTGPADDSAVLTTIAELDIL